MNYLLVPKVFEVKEQLKDLQALKKSSSSASKKILKVTEKGYDDVLGYFMEVDHYIANRKGETFKIKDSLEDAIKKALFGDGKNHNIDIKEV